MRSYLKILLNIVVLSLVAVLILGFNTKARATDPLDSICSQDEFKDSDVCTQKAAQTSADKIGSSNGLFSKIVSGIIYITASVSVAMIIVGAFKYVTSQGDTSATKSAKDTILYALVGLFIAISAYAIIAFVLARV